MPARHFPDHGRAEDTLAAFAALRAFHATAVKGRFRDAADSLGITESAISHQVRRLEDFLRVALFDAGDFCCVIK